jgi:hypothetical protein
MAPTCGFVKCKMVSTPKVQSSRHKNEIQYHLHVTVAVSGAGGSIEQWDTAINVGTNDFDDDRHRMVRRRINCCVCEQNAPFEYSATHYKGHAGYHWFVEGEMQGNATLHGLYRMRMPNRIIPPINGGQSVSRAFDWILIIMFEKDKTVPARSEHV